MKKLLREQRTAFDAEVAELTRQLDAKTAAQEKEARIEVLRKAAMRRMLFAAINRGWEAWRELTEARHEAREALRSLGSKIGAKDLGSCFHALGAKLARREALHTPCLQRGTDGTPPQRGR